MSAPRVPEQRAPAVVEPRAVTRAAITWSWALALVGLLTLAAQVVSGAALPPLLPTLGLALVLALCIGRGALYPGELAATAELAVLLCAVVAFRDDAPVTGPLLLALLVGPLDRDHWRQRSFVRMAYNSGDRAVASLGAVGTFAGITALLGSSTGASVAAIACAALVATALDSAATVGLVVCLGGNARAARRELFDVDALALPLAALGGAVGFLATGVGWWAAAAPLLALALVPELLQARALVPARFARRALLAVELVAALAVVAWFATPPSLPIVLVLCVLTALVGLELLVDDRAPVAPALGLVVTVVAIVVGGAPGVFAGALVAGGATAIGWCTARNFSWTAVLATALAVAVGASVGRLVVVHVDSLTWSWPLTVAGVGLFAVGALLVGRAPWRSAATSVMWAAPLAIAPVALLLVRDVSPTVFMAIVAIVIVVTTALCAWCGSTPWRSRVLSSRAARSRLSHRHAVFVATGAVAVVASLAAVLGADDDVRRAASWLAVAAGVTASTMALWATRQWRFAPRARTRQAAILGATAVGWCVVAVLAEHAQFGAAAIAAVVVTVVVLACGSSSVRAGDRSS